MRMTPDQIAAIMLDAVGNPEAGPLPPAVQVMAEAVAEALTPAKAEPKATADK